MGAFCGACLSYRCRCEPEPVRAAPVLAVPLALWPTTTPSNGTDTSDAAAASLSEDQINDGHRAVLNALWRYRHVGLTDEQIQTITALNPSTERPSRGELVAGLLVRDTGERRPTLSGRPAIVWKLTEEATRQAETQIHAKRGEAA